MKIYQLVCFINPLLYSNTFFSHHQNRFSLHKDENKTFTRDFSSRKMCVFPGAKY